MFKPGDVCLVIQDWSCFPLPGEQLVDRIVRKNDLCLVIQHDSKIVARNEFSDINVLVLIKGRLGRMNARAIARYTLVRQVSKI